MIKNYIKIAWRSLLKNKGFTAINIVGLALGLAVTLLIVFYIADELSYDKYNNKADRIYRVNADLKLGNNKVQYATVMAPLASTLIKDFPEVENAVRLLKGAINIKKGNKNLVENDVVFADPSVFDVFTLQFIQGDKKSALIGSNTVVVSASAAKKYFDKQNAIGKILNLPGFGILKVTGVIKDMPKQSHFRADFIISMSTWADSRSTQWLQNNYNTYVLIREGADQKKLEAAFPQVLIKYSGDEIKKDVGMNYEQFEKSGSYFRLNFMSLTDIHLHSNMTGDLAANGSMQYIYIFSAIAVFILLIACINFINLSTARSSNRALEVGVRKVLGSSRGYLIGQFLTESVLITFIAVIIAFVLAALTLPAFNNISAKNLLISELTSVRFLLFLLLAVIIIGLSAGIYPAFFLSGFKPVSILKGKVASGFKGSRIRSIMVVFQFSMSVFLIIGTLVVYQQLKYVQTRDIGYNRSQVLVVHDAWALRQNARAFKQEIARISGVEGVTLSGFLPTTLNRNSAVFYKDATKDPKKSIFPQAWRVDEDYIKTLNMKITAGRDFLMGMATDSDAIIINETAAKFLGVANPIGEPLYREEGANRITKRYNIIGVVKDFNFDSMRENISPVVMMLDFDSGNLAVRIKPGSAAGMVAQIEKKWQAMAPAAEFSYSFMDADFDSTYRAEQRIGQISLVFTSLAIIIACLGLFGLSAYAAEQRTKEIGIRKVLGASVALIVKMLSVDFIKLVFIASVIAAPVAWAVMHKWLQTFAYRIDMHWWLFVAAGMIAALVALIVIGMQSVKAATISPVKSLRSE